MARDIPHCKTADCPYPCKNWQDTYCPRCQRERAEESIRRSMQREFAKPQQALPAAKRDPNSYGLGEDGKRIKICTSCLTSVGWIEPGHDGLNRCAKCKEKHGPRKRGFDPDAWAKANW